MARALDCRGTRRGRCFSCVECKEFEAWEKNIRCGYCDCPPTKHEYCVVHENTNTSFAADGSHDLDISSPSKDMCAQSAPFSYDNKYPTSGKRGLKVDPKKIGSFESVNTIKKQNLNSLKCPVCRKKFSKAQFLTNHVLLHRGKKHFKCSKCSKVFQDFPKMLKHKAVHKSKRQKQEATTTKKADNQMGLNQKNQLHDTDLQKKQKNDSSKKQELSEECFSTVAAKKTVAPSYASGVSVWSTPAQNAFLMNPLTGSFVPQVSIPAQPILQHTPANPVDPITRGCQGQCASQGQGFLETQSALSLKILNLLQVFDSKLLNQLDRKVDFILHYLNVPRQTVHEAPHFTFESEQAVSQLQSASEPVEGTAQSPRVLSHSLHERIEFERGLFDPSQPIPENVLEEVYKASVSRRNLAKNLVFLLFSADELRGKNCAGKVYGRGLPKERLNTAKLHAVKVATFKKYPCEPSEIDLVWQRECVKAIDKAIRSRALSNKL